MATLLFHALHWQTLEMKFLKCKPLSGFKVYENIRGPQHPELSGKVITEYAMQFINLGERINYVLRAK